MAYATAIPAHQTLENIDWILDRWHHLEETRIKGTPRPWREPTLTPEQRAALDAQARVEKLEHGAFVLGESEAPLHLDTLDLMTRTAADARAAVRIAAEDLGHYPVLVHAHRSADDNPAPLLAYLRAHLTETEEGAAAAISATISGIRRNLAGHFGEITDGQRLKAECPWCRYAKLFVRLIGPEAKRQPVIRCQSGVCEPPPADCGTWHHGLPSWPIQEWDWLANRINYAEHKVPS